MPAPRLLLAALLALTGAAAAAVATGADSGGGAALGTPGSLVSVGPGISESSIRQAVRTAEGRVYIVAADDGGNNGTETVLRMYRADQLGVPTSFSEADAANHPALDEISALNGGDARLARDGTIHVSWYRRTDGTAIHQTFSPAADRWGPAEEVNPGSSFQGGLYGVRGVAVTALALSPDGVPFVALTGPGFVRVYRRAAAGSWPVKPIDSGSAPQVHPSLSFDRRGRLHLAWLDDAGAPGTAIRYARREADGSWTPSQTVAQGDVLGNGNRDQSPSLAVDRADRPVVAYLDGTGAEDTDFIRTRVLTDSGWVADDPSPDVDTHTPGLHLRGDDRLVLEGHDIPGVDPAYVSRAAGASGWSAERVFAAALPPGSREYDGSANSRFDPNLDPDCNLVDAVFFDENSDTRGGDSFAPDLYYAAIRLPAEPCTQVVGTPVAPAPPAGDRTRPRLSRVGVSRRRFRRGARGVRLRFRLSERARVRVRAGRRTFTVRGRKGRNRVRLALRRRLRYLRPGRHRLRLRATDRAGNRSRPAGVRIRVLRPARRRR